MIQIDMQMPENCRMCPACSEYDICLIPIDGKGFGEQNVSEFIDSRPEWCPMKEQEVKTGHWTILTMCANEGIYCSECQTKVFDAVTKPKKKLSQFCPNCGSRNEQFFKDGEVVFR